MGADKKADYICRNVINKAVTGVDDPLFGFFVLKKSVVEKALSEGWLRHFKGYKLKVKT